MRVTPLFVLAAVLLLSLSALLPTIRAQPCGTLTNVSTDSFGTALTDGTQAGYSFLQLAPLTLPDPFATSGGYATALSILVANAGDGAPGNLRLALYTNTTGTLRLLPATAFLPPLTVPAAATDPYVATAVLSTPALVPAGVATVWVGVWFADGNVLVYYTSGALSETTNNYTYAAVGSMPAAVVAGLDPAGEFRFEIEVAVTMVAACSSSSSSGGSGGSGGGSSSAVLSSAGAVGVAPSVSSSVVPSSGLSSSSSSARLPAVSSSTSSAAAGIIPSPSSSSASLMSSSSSLVASSSARSSASSSLSSSPSSSSVLSPVVAVSSSRLASSSSSSSSSASFSSLASSSLSSSSSSFPSSSSSSSSFPSSSSSSTIGFRPSSSSSSTSSPATSSSSSSSSSTPAPGSSSSALVSVPSVSSISSSPVACSSPGGPGCTYVNGVSSVREWRMSLLVSVVCWCTLLLAVMA